MRTPTPQPKNATSVLRDFGKRVRRFRTQRGLTQEQLAALSGLPIADIRQIERGLNDLDLSDVFRLAQALGELPPTLFIPPDETSK